MFFKIWIFFLQSNALNKKFKKIKIPEDISTKSSLLVLLTYILDYTIYYVQ